jgi:ABC-type branched-subunit amino acid transport system ATPase component
MFSMPTSSGNAGPAAQGLEVADVVAGYGGAPVLKGLSLTVSPGQVVAVVGPNGAGKSTLMRAITGTVRISSGIVTIGGVDITKWSSERRSRRGLGYVPQSRDVFDSLTVQENLSMGGYMLPKREVDDRITNVFSLFPSLLPLRTRVASKLSGGERKLLGIGRALVATPTVLLLDEPTASLSPELSKVILTEHVRRLADTGVAVLLVEQKALQALEVSDWAHVLVGGETRISGPSGEVLARRDIREVFLGAAALAIEASTAEDGKRS